MLLSRCNQGFTSRIPGNGSETGRISECDNCGIPKDILELGSSDAGIGHFIEDGCSIDASECDNCRVPKDMLKLGSSDAGIGHFIEDGCSIEAWLKLRRVDKKRRKAKA